LHELRGKKADLERTKLQLTSMLKNLDQGTMRSDEEQKIHYAITSVDSLLNGMKE
jgi:phage tail tube protein FII